MTLNQLYYFVEVCRVKNVTKAAENLNISQPSLSVAIRNLEQELGVSLFHRNNKKITLTNDGKHFRKKLIPLTEGLDELKTEMISRGEKSNVLRIGIPPMIGAFIFPKLFTGFHQKYPDIKVEIVEFGTLKLQKMMLDDELDLSLFLEESQLNSEIVFTPIEQRHFRLYVNNQHPLSLQSTASVIDLKDAPLIMFNRDFHVARVVRRAFKRVDLSPNIVLESTQINTIHNFVKQNMALSVLIEGSLAEEAAYTMIPIEGIAPITVGYARKKDHFMTSSASKMMRFIDKYYTPDTTS